MDLSRRVAVLVVSSEERGLIKSFVKDILGCGCPDEVFDSIHSDIDHSGIAGISRMLRLTIGERLLIYCLELDPAADVRDAINQLIDHGVRCRAKNDLNRLRIVCVTDDSEFALSRSRAQLFSTIDLPDDRVHLHQIAASEIHFF